MPEQPPSGPPADSGQPPQPPHQSGEGAADQSSGQPPAGPFGPPRPGGHPSAPPQGDPGQTRFAAGGPTGASGGAPGGAPNGPYPGGQQGHPQGPPPQGAPPGAPPGPPPGAPHQGPPHGPPPGSPQGPPPGAPSGPPNLGKPQGPPPGQPYPPYQGGGYQGQQPGQHPGPQQQPGQPGWQQQPPGQPPYGGQPYPQPGQQPPFQQGSAPKKGRGGLIGGLVAGLVVLVLIALAGWWFLLRDDGGADLADVSAGDCLSSSDIGAGNESVGDLEVVDCGDGHDAEAFATVTLDGDQADDYDDALGGQLCAEQADEKGRSLADLGEESLEVRPLIPDGDLSDGDELICVVRHADGDELTDSVF